MAKRKYNKNKIQSKKEMIKEFQKSLVSFILIVIFFSIMSFRFSLPNMVIIFIGIPWLISIVHKAIDIYHKEDDPIYDQWADSNNEYPYNNEDASPLDSLSDELDLEEFKELRKEWKDSDFV